MQKFFVPFLAFAFSVISSEDVANTRRCNSSSPIRPSVKLNVACVRGMSVITLSQTYPAKTPPARTRAALKRILYQNSGDQGSGTCRGVLASARNGEAVVALAASNRTVGYFMDGQRPIRRTMQ